MIWPQLHLQRSTNIYVLFSSYLKQVRPFCTVCPRSSYPLYVVSYYIKGVTASWMYSVLKNQLTLYILSVQGVNSRINPFYRNEAICIGVGRKQPFNSLNAVFLLYMSRTENHRKYWTRKVSKVH